MVGIESFFRYLTGWDLIEDRRILYQSIGSEALEERSLGLKIIDFMHDAITFGSRYTPIIIEVDGVRRLFDGQYVTGTMELLVAEYIRIDEFLDNKKQRASMEEDSAIRERQLYREIERELQESRKPIQESEAMVEIEQAILRMEEELGKFIQGSDEDILRRLKGDPQ